MSETVMWAVHLLGWLAVLIVMVARDMRREMLWDHDCDWPVGIVVGWAWPVAAFAYLFVYLPAVALNKVIKCLSV